MTTAASVPNERPELTFGSMNGFAYLPAMPGIAYRVLTKLIGIQEPGGRCEVTEQELAEMLDVHRSLVGRGLFALTCGRLVFRTVKGVYRLNPMVAGFRTVTEQLQAIDATPWEDRLDVEDYQARYDEAVAQAEEDRRNRAAARRKGQQPPPEKPSEAPEVEDTDVLDFAAARRTRRRAAAKK
ncbi:hypothetical protein ACIQKB_35980 [Streptomyces sp. NPDC092046]|uniref:hypothetical protein n=1 Tax=Streptomyces sp. NPDC092046 TaxID=3366009 RepID=UPI003809D6C0